MGEIAVYDNVYCHKPRIVNYRNCKYSYTTYFNGGYLLVRLSKKPTSTLQDD